MTCPFCNREDGSYDIKYHYLRHQIEEIRRLVKAIDTLNDILDERLPAMSWKEGKVRLPMPEPDKEIDG